MSASLRWCTPTPDGKDLLILELQEIHSGESQLSRVLPRLSKSADSASLHYCIAAWGTARALAEALGETNAARSMERAIKEGKSFDEELTELAEKEITPALLSQSPDEDEGAGGNRSRVRNGGERRAT
jgi:ferritin-like metal-binding protein YciE